MTINKPFQMAFAGYVKYSAIIAVVTLLTSQFSFADSSDQAGKYYERAVLEYRNKHNKAAILELKNAIQQNPNYLAAQILLAKAYLNERKLTATEAALSRADELNADPDLLVETRAQLYLYQLKYGLLLRDILPADYDQSLHQDLHLFRGQAYLQLTQLDEALQEFERAEKIDASRIEAVVGRATVLLRMGQIESAREIARKASIMQPDFPGSWYVKAIINHSQGNLETAIAEYSKAIDLDASYYDALIARAGILMDLHRDDEAEKDLLNLRKAYPFDANVAYLHSLVLARNNYQDKALEALTAASVLLDGVEQEYLAKHAQSLMLSALVNYSLKRFDLAVHALNIYIQNYPKQSGAYKMLATILMDKGEYKRTIKLLQPVLKFARNDYRVLFLLGRAYMQNGQHDQANAMLEQASKLEQQGIEISTELGLSRLAMGQKGLAINELEKAIKSNPKNTKAGIPLTLLYLNQKQPGKAFQIAKSMYEHAPENLTLINLLGTAQVGMGKTDEARKNYVAAITKDPGFISAHLNLSKLDVIEQKSNQAIENLKELHKHYPEKISLMIELARVYEVNGNFDEALVWLEKARYTDSNSIPVTLALINLALKAERYPEALNLALEAQKQSGDNIQVLDALARSFMANGNQGKAAGVLRGMSRMAGFNAKKLYQISRQQFAMDDIPAAIKSLKNAVSGNKNFIPARIALAEAELKTGNTIFALNHAKFLIEFYPDRPHGYRLLGDISTHQKQKTQAIKNYQTAFEKGSDAFFVMKLYRALKQNNEHPRAFQLIEKWVKENKGDAVVMQVLAEEYLSAGQLKEAKIYYEKLLGRFNNRPDIMNNLAYIYFHLNDDRALSFAQQAQKLAPDQPSANDTLGWILVNQDEPEQGLHYLRNAHARSSSDPEIRYHIAVALHKLQRPEEAKVELKQALLTNRPFNGSEQAKRLLKKLNG